MQECPYTQRLQWQPLISGSAALLMLVNVYFFPVSNPFLENTLAGLFPALNFQWYFDVPPLFLISTQKDNLCCYLVSRASQVAGGEELPGNSGDAGLIPGSGRSAGEGNGNPLQYSCLRNPMDRGVWWATVHGVAKVRQDLATKPLSKYVLAIWLSPPLSWNYSLKSHLK